MYDGRVSAVIPEDARRTVYSYWQQRNLPQLTPEELERTLAEWERQQEEWGRDPQALDRRSRDGWRPTAGS